MQKKVKSKILFIIVGICLISIGCVLLSYKYFNLLELKQFEENQLESFFKEQIQAENEEEEIKQENNKVEKINDISKESYIAVIEIPKISLKKGIYHKNSKYNNVKQNIQILNESSMPEDEKGNFILVAHSGNSNISYFKNINKLEKKDIIYIYFNNTIYLYEVVDKYEIEKNGQASIRRNPNKEVLTMITCKSGTNKQIVIVSELAMKEEY